MKWLIDKSAINGQCSLAMSSYVELPQGNGPWRELPFQMAQLKVIHHERMLPLRNDNQQKEDAGNTICLSWHGTDHGYRLVIQHSYWKMTIYSGFSTLKMVIFHSYVSLPEGTLSYLLKIPSVLWFNFPRQPAWKRPFKIISMLFRWFHSPKIVG